MVRRTWAAALAAVLLLMGMAGSAVACPSTHARPFHATATGEITYDFTNPMQCSDQAFPFTSVVVATGHATHLGQLTVNAAHCESMNRSTDGVLTLTMHKGDQIKGTYTTRWVVQDNQVVVTGWLLVTGGTGRFAHAQGRLWQHHVITLTDVMPPWPVTMHFTGTIRY